jgi:hypothetical protein
VDLGHALNLRHHFLANPEITTGISILAAVGMLPTAQAAYWCNASFAYTIAQAPRPSTGLLDRKSCNSPG